MNLASNTVLITGGASGIGLAIAERFLEAGSEVIICGRRESKLLDAKSKFPRLHTRVCDIAVEAERIRLFQTITHEFLSLNVLVNNAGIQRRIQLEDQEPWEETAEEIRINLEAPIHLSRLFIPHLKKQATPYLINVSSGLAFVPLAYTPVYSATKAALHSFTVSLRHQLADTPIKVIEIIPPAVNTDLGGPGKHTFGAPLKEYADATIAGLTEGKLEIPYEFSTKARFATKKEWDELFIKLHRMAH